MAVVNVNRLTAANIPYTFKQLCKMIDNGKVSFKNIVQRSYTWETKRRSEFIWSVIMNYPIPPIYAGRDIDGKNKVLDIMDGQQRITTVYKFLKDEFALTDLQPIPYEDENGEEQEMNISGLKFSELDEELQELIRDRNLTINYYDDIEQNQKTEMFKRLNNGKPLTAKNRALASCCSIEELLDIGSHPLFDEMLTQKSKDNKNQVILVMKAWSMLNQNIEDVSFESKTFNPMLETVEVSDEERLQLVEVFNLIQEVHSTLMDTKQKRVARKLYTETHLISVVPFFAKAVEDGIESDLMADWISEFFTSDNGASVSEEYNLAAGAGSAKNVNVNNRNTALSQSFEDFFNTDNEEIETNLDEEEDNTSLVDEIMNDTED